MYQPGRDPWPPGVALVVATLAALLAAALFAIATALQHRSAGLVAGAGSREKPRPTTFMAKALRHPLWLTGFAADIAGFAVHALALREGPLTLVQPLLVSSVVFALPLRQLLEHRPPRGTELGWAAALAAGLVLFLTIATPVDGTAQPADVVPTTVSAVLIGLGIVGCSALGRRSTGSRAAVLLGTGAALAFACVAGLLKEAMDIFAHRGGVLAVGRPVGALVVVGAIGFALNQLAYQAGPLSSSLPAITTVDTLVSVVIGVAVFDEQFRHGPGDLLGEALGLALVVAAGIFLSRSAAPVTNSRPLPPKKELQVEMAATGATTRSRLAHRGGG